VTYVRSESRDIAQIEIRRSKIEDNWNEFQQVQAAIEETAEAEQNKNEHFPYREDFEELYFKIATEATKMINAKKKKDVDEMVLSDERRGDVDLIQPQAMIKLPALDIPIFSGQYEEWSSFYDIFLALIHTNKSLTAIQKFYYLRSFLSSDAKECIKCLETTAANYEAAWSTLIARYNNTKILIQTHVKNIVELPSVKDKSSVNLRKLSDTLNSNIRALEALGEKPYDWGPLLSHIVCAKLDNETRKDWEIQAAKDKIPSIRELTRFIEERFRILESVESSRDINNKAVPAAAGKGKEQAKTNNITKGGQKYSANFVSTTTLKCYICNLEHTIYKCPTFLTLPISERIEKIACLKLCKICLRKHEGKCFSRFCFKCSKPHNTLLHLQQKKVSDSEGSGKDVETAKNRHEPVIDATSSTTAHANNNYERVLLATAVVRVINPCGKSSFARVLLDSGSMNNFISTELVNSLSLRQKKTDHVVSGIGGTTQNITSTAWLKIKSCVNDYELNIQALMVKKITGNLPTKFISENGPRPANIILADPLYNVPQKIDILIGAVHFFEILGKQQYLSLNGPSYQETRFGFVASGSVQGTVHNKISVAHISTNLENDEYSDIEKLIKQFWQSEEYIGPTPYTIEEKACTEHFNNTVRREEGGRFVVQLPFRKNLSKLGKSYAIAKRRLLSIERRLDKNPALKCEYVKFMREYESLGHMTYVSNEEIDIPEKMCYLAHHCVLNLNSSTTKLRVVFDASTKTETGVSLNDVLLKGPVIQDDLIYILARFRVHNFVISADIRKMYRQINVSKEHQDFQRILWRENSNSPIKIFKLNTITYGTVPASYLATACLQKLAEDEYKHNTEISIAISRDFYMDDFLSGAPTKAEAIKLRDRLIEIMATAKMELGKWSSNDSSVLNVITHTEKEQKNVHEINDSFTKILGMYWNAETDSFHFKINLDEDKQTAPVTKRDILSDIARIFDPLGLVGPVVIRAKLMLQVLWQAQVKWCEPVSDDIQCEWNGYKTELLKLNDLRIPRQITMKDKICDMQIHGFSDASEKAYGCCLYLRCSDKAGNHCSNLICAKSKVAPMKTVSLPRLELCAAQLLTRVAYKIISKMQLKLSKHHYWTDSKVTLCWIKSTSKKWKTFVSHRVGEIQEKTSLTEWFHVKGSENPADIISRGCSPTELSRYTLWWHGPEWLIQNEEHWPVVQQEEISNEFVDMPEQKGLSVSGVTISENDLIVHRYSSIKKMSRIIAYCMRFKSNCLSRKQNNERKNGFLQPYEIKQAKTIMVKIVQNHYFSREVQQLLTNKQVSKKSPLYRLIPYLDEAGIIRVGGRLKYAASISIFRRHPAVLPAKSIFTQNLIREEHEDLMHGGSQAVLASIRERYWPINGRNVTRNVVRKCVICFKQRPTIVQPIMGDLPKDRVEPSRAFLKCGIDYAGPFLLKSGLRKNSPIIKAYVCLFICFSTRAVHLELVSDLSTDAFLRALNRFFDRRGRSLVMYSDNATNFVGANRQLKELYELLQGDDHQIKTAEMLSTLGVEWRFIPPRSPHFGGLWEAGIKSMKYLLRRVLGDAHLTYEELLTILTRAEACLNSRPLTPISSDPNDLIPLAPSHFLIGDSLNAIPEIDETSVPSNRLNRWRRVSQYSQNLWKRWSSEYLSQLQERSKWARTNGPKLKVGSVVLLKDENLPPLQWRMGRVSKVTRGKDEVVRVAEVQTAGGTVSRAVRKLCPLPFEENSEE